MCDLRPPHFDRHGHAQASPLVFFGAQRLLYGVRVTCHRFSPRGLVTALLR